MGNAALGAAREVRPKKVTAVSKPEEKGPWPAFQ
jgi:hypothetical protein